MWTKNALRKLLPTVLWTDMRRVMPLVAFKYKSGPFRNCYTRWGAPRASLTRSLAHSLTHPLTHSITHS